MDRGTSRTAGAGPDDRDHGAEEGGGQVAGAGASRNPRPMLSPRKDSDITGLLSMMSQIRFEKELMGASSIGQAVKKHVLILINGNITWVYSHARCGLFLPTADLIQLTANWYDRVLGLWDNQEDIREVTP